MRKKTLHNDDDLLDFDKYIELIPFPDSDDEVCKSKDCHVCLKPQKVLDIRTVAALRTITHASRLVFVTDGTANVVVNGVEYFVSRNTLCLTPPDSIISKRVISDDCKWFVTMLNLDVFEYFQIEDLPVVLYVKEKDRDLVINFFRLQHALLADPDEEHLDFTYSIVAFLHKIKRWHSKSLSASPVPLSRKSILLKNFLHILSLPDTRLRTVAEFANNLGVNPNYLSVVVKRETGKTPKDWIDQKLESDIRRLLLHPDNLSLDDIAQQVGYSSAAQVARFIRRRSGLSTSEYRKQSPTPRS